MLRSLSIQKKITEKLCPFSKNATIFALMSNPIDENVHDETIH